METAELLTLKVGTLEVTIKQIEINHGHFTFGESRTHTWTFKITRKPRSKYTAVKWTNPPKGIKPAVEYWEHVPSRKDLLELVNEYR
jgi:hypothetical protein